MYRVTASQINTGARTFTHRWIAFDFVLLFTTMAACAFGVVMVYSATHGLVPDSFTLENSAVHHLFNVALGVALMLMLTQVEYHMLQSFVWPLYGGMVALLAITTLLGHTAGGATRWVKIGDLPIQPSEIAKLVLVLTLAKYLSDNQKRTKRVTVYLTTLLITGVPMALIFSQPDVGTALVCGFIWLTMIITARLRWTYLAGSLLLGIPAAVGGWILLLRLSGNKFQYVQDRFLIFLHPESDSYGQGYNIVQARISIGAGGLFGKGFLAGTQSQLHFLKVQYADFIFSVIAEEFGLFGALALVALLYVIVLRYLFIAARAPDVYGTLIAVGLAAWLGLHVFVNVGMNLSLMPVVGIPLPFISYGGSSMLSLLAAQGLLQSIAVRSRKVIFA